MIIRAWHFGALPDNSCAPYKRGIYLNYIYYIVIDVDYDE
jgi:hypothetical protein